MKRAATLILGGDHVERALRIIGFAVVLAIVLGAVSVSKSENDTRGRKAYATQTRKIADTTKAVSESNRQLGSRVAGDEVAECKRVNQVVDGLYSVVDSRSPVRAASLLTLRSTSASDVQRATALTAIHNLDVRLATYRKKFTTIRCLSPKETP